MTSPAIQRARQLAAEYPSATAAARIQWARGEAATARTLTDLDIAPIGGIHDFHTDDNGLRTIDLAAEGWTLTLGVRWDDMTDPADWCSCEHGPNDVHDEACWPRERVYVTADVHDPAGNRISWDALFGIGTDNATRDPYVVQVLADCAANACAEAGVAPCAGEVLA